MYKFDSARWLEIKSRSPRAFVCWNCGKQVASEKAYETYDGKGNSYSIIYGCPNCNAPIIVDDQNKEVLSSSPGLEIKNLPENIGPVYNEIRKCMQVGCPNGAIMLMRKLIMHISVEEGAEGGKNFEFYVDYLCTNGIVPKKSKNKADSVRLLGNTTNHEVENRTIEEAQNCFEFIELLLKVNYEFADEGENEE